MKHQKMNPEFKVKWLEALRSGKYEQGQVNLRSKQDKFCCLGVACDLEAKDGLLVEIDNGETFGYWSYRDASDEDAYRSSALLPSETTERTGISDEVANLLTVMNDTKLMTFNEIADWIEENL